MSTVPTSARILGAIGRGLITAGIVVLLFVGYQLWGTNLAESRAQDDLRGDFADALATTGDQLTVLRTTTTTTSTAPTTSLGSAPDDTTTTTTEPLTTPTLPGGLDPAVLAYFFPEDGDAVARLEMPAIGVDKIVVNGVKVADLRKGPGHYPRTARLGTDGNAAIAGHRTTYGAPFNRIDELVPGDEITVTSIFGRFTYRVMAPEVAYADQLDLVEGVGPGHIIVKPSATWVLGDFGDNRITLTACHPKLSARQRIIVAAELVDEPVVLPDLDPELVAAVAASEDLDVALPGEPGVDATGDPGEPVTDIDGPAPDTTPAPTDAGTGDLDEGLNGERGAIPGATLWMLAAIVLWIGGGYLARARFEELSRRVAVRAAVLVPVGVCLWYSFEMIDRALPAG